MSNSKIQLLCLIGAIGGLGFGSQALYVCATNMRAAEFTIDEYDHKRPDNMWLSLTGCHLNLLEASYASYFGSPEATEVFIPIRSANASPSDPIVAYLGTDDTHILATMTELNKLKSKQEIESYVSKNRDRIFSTRSIRGTVRHGIDLDREIVDDLRRTNTSLDKDFIIINEGERPDWFKAIIMLLTGAAFVWVTRLLFRSSRQSIQPQVDVR
jgi:hypothetical protein